HSPGVHFYITGKLKPGNADIVSQAPANAHFTDFLSNDDYYRLLNTANAVMCLTTRNHTMQRGACEALSLGKPIITSDWPLLRAYFNKGTMHVDNSAEGIRQGIIDLLDNIEAYEHGIKDLQVDQQKEWQKKIGVIVDLIRRRIR
ncbi:MAG: glycosyltransferase, partial [Anaerolineae bacterium]|nr:glycosyltransferase [Anaerolineae bacterium]